MRRRSILFFRDYHGYTGGHLKVWDYYNHIRFSKHYSPKIYFIETTIWDSSNPWLKERDKALKEWDPRNSDILFLAGTDWQVVPYEFCVTGKTPILNLIQSVRHAEHADIRYQYLTRKAIRICVSKEVEEAIRKTRIVNGPIFTIPNCLNTENFPMICPIKGREYHIIVAGAKAPEMAKRLRDHLEHINVKIYVSTEYIERSKFLDLLNSTLIIVILPNPSEGFFLPALEAMALQTIVICPDCVGNRSFCLDGLNCLRPAYTFDEIKIAIEEAMLMSESDLKLMLANAKQTVLEHDIRAERQAFLEILEDLDHIWR